MANTSAGSEAERSFELGENGSARIFEVGYFGAQPFLLDLRPQHVLQSRAAGLGLSPGVLLKFFQQPQSFPVDANALRQEMQLVEWPFDIVGGLQNRSFKRKILCPAFGRSFFGAHAQLFEPRQFDHQTRHYRHHYVLYVHLERKARIRQGTFGGDPLNRGGIIVIGGRYVGVVEHRIPEKIRKTRIRRKQWQRWSLSFWPVCAGDLTQRRAFAFLGFGRNAAAPCSQ